MWLKAQATIASTNAKVSYFYYAVHLMFITSQWYLIASKWYLIASTNAKVIFIMFQHLSDVHFSFYRRYI